MLRGAIIGIGKIAQTGHLPAFESEALRNQVEIIAAADQNPQSRALAERNFPRLRLYEDAATLLAHEHVDFVDICTTPQYHREGIETAIQKNIPVLCEKPLASSLEDASRVRELLQTDGRKLAFVPCHQYRYSPLWRHFEAFLKQAPPESGCFLEFSVFRTEADPGLHRSSTAWRTQRATSGGGILADTGVHYLYLTLWMLGEPRMVTARMHRLAHQRIDVEDTAVVILEYEKSVVEINLTWGAARRANSARCVTPFGDLVYDGQSLVRHAGDAFEQLPVPDASDKSHYISMYVDLIRVFLKEMAGKTTGSAWIDEAYNSVRLLHACYRSAETGKTILLDEIP